MAGWSWALKERIFSTSIRPKIEKNEGNVLARYLFQYWTPYLGVTMGVNRHVEVGIVWKLDLQGLRFFLGRDNVYLRHVRDGRPVAQLPFLTLSIIQPVRSLEGGTHFGVLPEYGTKHEFLERRLWRSS
jgi:hypothetical protein